MGMGAATAICKLLKRTGLSLDDIDLFEINEPFASIGLATLNQLGLTLDRVNLNGSALALGHPYGMSGTRLSVLYYVNLNESTDGWGLLPHASAEAWVLPHCSSNDIE